MNYLSKVAHQLYNHSQRGDIIVVPGGQNADNTGTTSSFGLAIRYNRDIDQVEYLGVPKLRSAFKNGELVSKHPEIHFLEEPKGTMVREVLEETGLKAIQCIDLGFRQRPHYEKAAGVHLQNAYLITLYDDRNLHKNIPMDEKTGIPLWIPESLFTDHIWSGHRWILESAEKMVKEETIQLMTFESIKKCKPAA